MTMRQIFGLRPKEQLQLEPPPPQKRMSFSAWVLTTSRRGGTIVLSEREILAWHHATDVTAHDFNEITAILGGYVGFYLGRNIIIKP